MDRQLLMSILGLVLFGISMLCGILGLILSRSKSKRDEKEERLLWLLPPGLDILALPFLLLKRLDAEGNEKSLSAKFLFACIVAAILGILVLLFSPKGIAP